MTYYRMIGQDNKPVFRQLLEGKEVPEGAVVVDRLPGPFEDFVDGQWVIDHKAKADQAAGSAHIDEARALKYLEALLIKEGITPTDGMLVQEAQQKGLTLQELSDMVLQFREEFIQKELQRQAEQEGGE